MEKNDLTHQKRCVVIGGSAGSLKVILTLLPDIKTDLGFPILIILHRRSDNRSSLENLLGDHTRLRVKEAEDKEPLLADTIYIAPAGYHLLLEKNYSLSLDGSEKVMYSRPSIDVSFQSAAEVYASGLLGIILSGANSDGAEGLLAVKKAGGLTAIQDPHNAEVAAMPLAALQKANPDHVLTDKHMAHFINKFGLP